MAMTLHLHVRLAPLHAGPQHHRSTADTFLVLFVVYAAIWLALIDPTRVTDSDVETKHTVVNDKYSCVRSIFPFHLACCWFTFLAGLAAMLLRALSYAWDFETYNELHMWAGRAYILGMLWTAATSTLIRNEGLPLGTLISFLWVLGGLTFGWVLIRVDHSSPYSRIAHGAFMFTSWFSIAGRIFNYNTAKDFQCYTFPVLKSSPALLMPQSDPHYHALPWADKEIWGWGIPLAAGPLVCGVLFGHCLLGCVRI